MTKPISLVLMMLTAIAANGQRSRWLLLHLFNALNSVYCVLDKLKPRALQTRKPTSRFARRLL